MSSFYQGDLSTKSGRRRAWLHGFFADHAFFRVFWSNFAVVKPGVLYRANQPTPAKLRALAREYGLKTLINLRGETKYGSAALSRYTARALGLDFYDMAFESRGAPHKDRILRLAGIYAGMRPPALIHCKSGADRAGLAAGLFLLLEGGTAEDALAQLSLRFGHIRQSSTGILDAFFRLYQLAAEGKKPFLDWVREDYDEAALRSAFKAGRIAEFFNATMLRRE